jgi:hypothetical protein
MTMGLFGNLFKSKATTTKNPFETNPWAPQGEALTKGFDASGKALDGALSAGTYQGNYTADMTGDQKGLLGQVIGNVGQTNQLGNSAIKAGQAGTAQFGNYLNNANGIMDTAGNAVGQGALTASGTALGAAGGTRVGGDQGMLKGFSGNANSLYQTGTANQTDGTISDAGKYADNPYLQSQIDASLNDVNKAFQKDVGEINGAAVGGGNINSTRAGTLEAYAMDDAMDRGAAISSQMRGAAYDKGLTMAQADGQSRFNNGITANDQTGSAYDRTAMSDTSKFNKQTDLASGYNANASTAQGMQDSTVNNMLNANGQVLNGTTTGMDLQNFGLDTKSNGLADGVGAANVFQGQNQAVINGNIAKQMKDAGYSQEVIAKYMASIQGNYGSSGFDSTTETQQSPFQTLIGGAATAAGIYGGLR